MLHATSPLRAWIRQFGRASLKLIMLAAAASAAFAENPSAGRTDREVLARVDRAEIRQSDVDFQLRLRQVSESEAAAAAPQILEDLIDRQLIREFLKQQRIVVPTELLDQQVERLRTAARARERDLDADLAAWGYSAEALRADLAIPLGWTIHSRKTISEEQVQQRFDNRRNRFDGSQRNVRHLVVVIPGEAPETDWDKHMATLRQAAEDIAAEKITFEAAVREHSSSPTRDAGGDLGWTAYRGDLPGAVAEAAFAGELGRVAGPVRSPFGVHLVLPVEERPGELSLEDARPQIMEELAGELWTAEVARLRAKAKIERP